MYYSEKSYTEALTKTKGDFVSALQYQETNKIIAG